VAVLREYLSLLRKNPFIPPMLPTTAATPPVGADWLHEAKLDGFRAQIHVENGEATLFSRNGVDLTKRFRAIRHTIERIPAKTAIIDCELVACGVDGMPDFKTLIELGNKAPALCLWCFDLLYLDGVRLMPIPLTDRKAILSEVIAKADDEHLQFSGEFADPLKLLAAGERTGLEGVVSKRRDSAYRSGRTRDWLKIKTATWRATHRSRWEMFQRT
jgi:bifunctional non-homologous end joining protein LigD